FVKMTTGYGKSLTHFLQHKWLSFPILFICFGLIAFFWTHIKKETAPYEDRSLIRVNVTAPEGSSYDYMDRFMTELTELVNDSIPEKSVNLVMTSPGFGSASVNSGRMRMTLVNPEDRERSQNEITEALAKQTKKYSEARAFVTQQPTISVSKRGGLPIQYIIQAPTFEKLREKIPAFMDEANNDPAFSVVDINLKFNRPE